VIIIHEGEVRAFSRHGRHWTGPWSATRSTTAAFHGHCWVGSEGASWSLPGRRYCGRPHMPAPNGRQVRGYVVRL